MARFAIWVDRGQATMLPECLEVWVDENDPVHVVDVIVDALDLAGIGFGNGSAHDRSSEPTMPVQAGWAINRELHVATITRF